MPTDFVIVRHGQTDWNLERRIQGSTDIPLNNTGITQAEFTRDALRDDPFDAVASSHLQRAAFTAATINQHHGKHHVIDARLAERVFGEIEGMTVDEVNQLFGSFDAVADVEWWDNVGVRMMAALDDLSAAYPDGRVLVVSHGSAIRAVLGAIHGVPPREVASTLNCGLTCLRRHDDGSWEVLSFNNNEHLPEDLRS